MISANSETEKLTCIHCVAIEEEGKHLKNEQKKSKQSVSTRTIVEKVYTKEAIQLIPWDEGMTKDFNEKIG